MVVFTSLQDPQLLELIQNGGVGVLPTDTIYGLVARAEDKEAVKRLYVVKQREGKPGTVVAASPEQVVALGIDARHVDAVAGLWPNPLSIVLPAPSALAYLDQGKESLAVRIPKDEQLRALLAQTGPLLTSSANNPGEPSSTTLDEAQVVFGEAIDFYVDGGYRSADAASTVTRLEADGSISTLREGPIKVDEKGNIL